MNVDRYHTTNSTATCNRPVFVGVRGWPISSMVTVKIYDIRNVTVGRFQVSLLNIYLGRDEYQTDRILKFLAASYSTERCHKSIKL